MARQSTIYVLEGSSGEYEDTSTWIVAVFTSKRKAEKFQARCEKLAKESYEEVRTRREEYTWESESEYPEPIPFSEDPDAEIYGDTSYSVSEVRLNTEMTIAKGDQ